MAPEEFDELGPIDYLVVEFAPGQTSFTAEMARELSSLAEAELIRLLDVLVLAKDAEGWVEATEIDELVGGEELRSLESHVAEILAADDIAELAGSMEPGTAAGVVVWENRWAGPFASAARRAGGQLIASGRIPLQEIVASLEADDQPLGA